VFVNASGNERSTLAEACSGTTKKPPMPQASNICGCSLKRCIDKFCVNGRV